MQAEKFSLSIMSYNDQSDCFSTISCGFMNMVMTNSPIVLPAGHQDSHAAYEFLIPLSSSPRLFVEKRGIKCHPGHLIPINPGQRHGIRRGHSSVSFISVFYDQPSMDRLIREVSGSPKSRSFFVDAYPLKTDIQLLISRLIHENKSNENGKDRLMECLAEELAVLLIRHYYLFAPNCELIPPEELTGEQTRFEAVIRYMQINYHNRLSVDDLAEKTGMNSFHFIRTFKRVFNVSPYSYLTHIRISNAKQLLTQTNLSVSDIGKRCGFRAASRFSAVFAKDTGQTPSAFRRQNARD